MTELPLVVFNAFIVGKRKDEILQKLKAIATANPTNNISISCYTVKDLHTYNHLHNVLKTTANVSIPTISNFRDARNDIYLGGCHKISFKLYV